MPDNQPPTRGHTYPGFWQGKSRGVCPFCEKEIRVLTVKNHLPYCRSNPDNKRKEMGMDD